MRTSITIIWLMMTIIITFSACKESPTGSEPEPEPEETVPELEAVINYSPESPEVGTEVTLDGTESKDDMDVGYDVQWSIEARPSGSSASINSPSEPTTIFTPDIAGDFTIQLVISNTDEQVSDTAQTTITSMAVSTEELSGDINTDQTLENVIEDPKGVDYLVTDNLFVNAALTIEPGVVLQFQEDVIMSINNDGSLIAEGTETDSIRFTTANQAGGLVWQGIFVKSASAQNTLEYAVLSYAGNSAMDFSGENYHTGIGILEGGKIKIEKSRIHHNNGYGVYADDDGGLLGVFKTNYMHNNSTGVGVSANAVSSISSDNKYTDNQKAAVEISGSALSEGNEVTWNALSGDAAYRVSGDLYIDGILTISPGTRFEMDENVLWSVNGALIASGTSSDHITFTTSDENGQLYWKGIYIPSTDGRNELSHTDLLFGGNTNMDFSGTNYSAIVGVDQGGKVSVTNSSFSNSKGYGLYIDDEGGVIADFSNNDFSGNVRAVGVPADEVDDMDTNTTFSENSEADVEIFASTYSETKKNTWQPLNNNSSYRVSGRLTVNGELSVAAGARFELDQDVIVYVDGALISNGESDNTIEFTTSNKSGDLYWKGLYFGSASSLNKLAYTKVTYAGESDMELSGTNYQAAVAVDNGANLSVVNSEITNNKGYGLYVDNEGGMLEDFSGNTFDNNTTGVGVPANEVDEIDNITVFTNNSTADVEIFRTTLSSGKEVTWNSLNGEATYRVSGDLIIDGVLTVQPGAHFEMNGDVQIYVSGAFIAEGTSSDLITFTSSNTSGVLWRGIFVVSSDSRNILNYVEVAYGGNTAHDFSGSNFSANIGVDTNAHLTITNSKITDSGAYGIYSKGTTNDFESAGANNTFERNQNGNVK